MFQNYDLKFRSNERQYFCECDINCSAKEYETRDQIVIGTTNESICEKNVIKNWNVAELCQKE